MSQTGRLSVLHVMEAVFTVGFIKRCSNHKSQNSTSTKNNKEARACASSDQSLVHNLRKPDAHRQKRKLKDGQAVGKSDTD